MSKQRDPKSGKFVRTTPDYKAMYLKADAERQDAIDRYNRTLQNYNDVMKSFKIQCLKNEFLYDHCPFWVKWLYKRQFKEGGK